MKFGYTFILALLLVNVSFSQTASDIYLPQYVQATGNSNASRVPYVCRLKLSGLTPNTTYLYYCRFVAYNATATNGGEGAFVVVNQSGNFTRISSPGLGQTSSCSELRTNAAGEYTGWFMTEVGTTNSIFGPGKRLKIRIFMNDGLGGITVANRATTSKEVLTMNFGTAATAASGKAIRSTAVTGGVARNFVMLWDNVDTTGKRPVSGTVIESDGMDASNNFAPFYVNDVNGVTNAWGTSIPNNLANGIRRIGQYSLATGDEVSYKISSNGSWPIAGGGSKSTVNTSQLTDTCIVLDGAIARLDGANIKTDQTITFNNLPVKIYGDNAFDAAASATSGLPLTYASNTISVADTVRDINNNLVLAVKGAGNADITASHPGDDFYNPASAVTRPLTVNKAELTVTARDEQIQLGDPIPSYSVSYSGFKYSDDVTALTTQPVATSSANSGSGAGRYEIIPAGGVAANYDFKYVSGWLTIVASQQPQKLDFAPIAPKTYGEPAFDPGAVAESGLPVEYVSSNTAVADTANGKVYIKGVGTTTITAKQGGNSGWLAARDTSVTLTVTKATLTITAENKKRKVGQPNPPLTVVFSGFVYGETPAVLTAQPVASTVADSNSGPAIYKITVTGAAADNYDIVYNDGELTVEALAAQTVTFTDFSIMKYGGADFKPSASASSGLPVTFSSSNPAVASIRNDSVIIHTAGTSVITASQAGNTTWGQASASQTLTVQKARLIIKADTVTINAGQPLPPLTVTYSGFVKNEDATVLTTLPVVTTTATANSVPGNYPITVSGAAAANYSIAQLSGVVILLPSQGAVQDNMLAYVSRPGQLQVNVFSVSGGKGIIQVFDLNGTRLVNVNVSLGKGYSTFQIPVGNVTPGIYNVRVSAAGVLLKSKVIIQ